MFGMVFLTRLVLPVVLLPVGASSAFVAPGTATHRQLHCRDSSSQSDSLSALSSSKTDHNNDDKCDDYLNDALFKMSRIMDPDLYDGDENEDPDGRSLLSRFHYDRADAVRIDVSTIPNAGMGVFAQRDLPAVGTVVSLYPVHAMGISFNLEGDDATRDQNAKQGSVWAFGDEDEDYYQDYFTREAAGEPGPNYLAYLLGHRPRESDFHGAVFVDANPDRPPCPGWLGHLVNDAATIVDDDGPSVDAVSSYLRTTASRENCAIVPFGPSPLLATVTTRPVARHEELFASYGVPYWLDALSDEEAWRATRRDPAVRALERDAAHALFRTMEAVHGDAAYGREAALFQTLFDSL